MSHLAIEDRRTVHGVLLAVFGRGTLLIGPSGSGKSNLALEMIDRGHSLVADDAVILTVRRGRLNGRAPDFSSRILFVRGIGMVDVVESFGPHAFVPGIEVEKCVELGGLGPDTDPVQAPNYQFFGVTVPLLRIGDASPSSFAPLVETWMRVSREDALRTADRTARRHRIELLRPDLTIS